MKCSVCKIDKLTNEFPPTTVTERCNHISTLCLRCLVTKINNQIKEPQTPSSSSSQPSRNSGIRCVECETPMSEKTAQDGGYIYVVLLNGHRIKLELAKVATVPALRRQIQEHLNHRYGMLIISIVVTQDLDNRQARKLSDYGIRNNSYIQLIVVLYSISKAEAIRSLIFELNWGFPDRGQDYLDGTCMVYAGAEPLMKYDYMSIYYPKFPHMRHYGDNIDAVNSRGNHKITAKLHELPEHVTHLYFILSAFQSNTIGEFKTPNFRLYDESQPDKQLCTYTIQDASDSQAVIMCCVSRVGNGMWHVIEVGKLTIGNANDYDPIMISISEVGLA
ncbi:12478_t:CDS:2 [Ambispora leptoticha]|uniref:12478_t:CDS:1 n=1 Tax=Ambispora leptoticha TaxID=144679 RepID=A0A9N8VE27_9GLOM|nr:12478_t:CDS:2 [Ambispora leptoticha]